MDDLNVAIGQRIKNRRVEKHLSQEELAKLCNLSQGIIGKIETGERKIQNYQLISIANVLETDCHWILTGVEAKNSSINQLTCLSDSSIEFLNKLTGKGEIQFRTEYDGYNETEKDEVNQMDIGFFGDVKIEAEWSSVLIKIINYLLSNQNGWELLSLLYKYCSVDYHHAFFEDTPMRWLNEIRFVSFEEPVTHISIPVELMRFSLFKAIENKIDEIRDEIRKGK